MLRIGAVSYLNTKPLIETLRDRLGGGGELSLNLPSRLASDLSVGRLDVALIPIVEYLRNPNYRIISDAAIACHGPVWSVRLLSRVPTHKIRTLALDEGSRTSAAMVQVLLAQRHGIRPRTVPLGIEQLPEAVDADAILLIGDRAMHPDRGVYEEIWDLGDRWVRTTGLPFVFAAWVARPGVDVDGLDVHLQASRDDGLQRLGEIARREAGSHGLTTEDLLGYFRNNLHFRLGTDEHAGIAEFQRRLLPLGLVPAREGTRLDSADDYSAATKPLLS